MRRPNLVLKSPSMDSESSDPIMIVHPPSRFSKTSSGAERRLLMASRYRTDSETTDEQCIPESISEAHDSAIDSTEDIVEEEDEEILDEVEKDLTKAKIQLQQTCVNQQQPLTLEIQSSTESDKTVLSLKHKDDINNSVPNSPGLMSLCSR